MIVILWFFVGAIIGYLVGYNWAVNINKTQYERILRAEMERHQNETAVLRSTNAELCSQISLMTTMNEGLETLKADYPAADRKE